MLGTAVRDPLCLVDVRNLCESTILHALTGKALDGYLGSILGVPRAG
jgi:hypothetical protein